MAIVREIKRQLKNANAVGIANLAKKGVELAEDATTVEIMRGIKECKADGNILDSEGVEF